MDRLSFTQRIREEHLDRIALISAVAASIGIEIARLFERIELRVGDVDRPEMDAASSLAGRPWSSLPML
jgi:hypothetical protein